MSSNPDNMLEFPVQKPAPVTPTRSETPSVMEYRPVGQTSPWRVERIEEFCSRLALSGSSEDLAKQLAFVHEALSRLPLWLTVRRLFGIQPVIPPTDTHPDDVRLWGADELCAKLGITRDLLEAQVEAARVAWESFQRREGPVETPPSPMGGQGEGELVFNEENTLREFGFSDSMFNLTWTEDVRRYVEDKVVHEKVTKRRDIAETNAEKSWFAQRVEQFRKMLSENRGGASTQARQVLLNELYARRLEADLTKIPTSSPDWEKLRQRKNELETSITDQHEKLAKMFPDLNVAGKVSFRQSIGDLTKGYMDYLGRDDNRLLNRMRTVTELEFETRQSVQVPVARMRLGQQIFILDAINGLWDPKWRPRFKPSVLKKLDAAVQAAIEASRTAEGESLVDLEDENSNFPDFQVLPNGEVQPTEDVSREGAKEAKE